jgi:glycosyltransferase involved in cell wall biosynthesis
METLKPTLLVINVHFAPNSFGGATVVAENMAVALAENHGWRVVVITTHQNTLATPYSLVRYTVGDIDVFSIVVPEEGALVYEQRYANEQVAQKVARIIGLLDVDVAHLHCIQSMGIGIIEILKDRKIPVATTVHDCWWICERMFMINAKGKYCHQERIDMNVCRYCVTDFNKALSRKDRLFEALNQSDRLLFPSQFHRDLYVQNDFPQDKCLVNKNGVLLPGARGPVSKDAAGPVADSKSIRFGFVGGPGDIKGAPLIKRAFSELPQANYQLLVVDGAQNRGLTWAKSFNWNIPGEIVIVPPYNRETMDEFFASIDVLLFPSQWKESFGLTVREAIARGVWVIATEAGGAIEDCEEGFNANIIPMDGDHLALSEALRSILDAGKAPAVQKRTVVSVNEQATELNQILSSLLPGRDNC